MNAAWPSAPRLLWAADRTDKTDKTPISRAAPGGFCRLSRFCQMVGRLGLSAMVTKVGNAHEAEFTKFRRFPENRNSN